MPIPITTWVRDILNHEDDVVYVLDQHLRIEGCNPAWDRFAQANGGIGISTADVRGHLIFEFIPEGLRPFYQEKYLLTLRTRQWVGFDYECSTSDKFRLFHMAMHSIGDSGLLVVNSYVPSRRGTLETNPNSAKEALYLSPDGSVTMCAHCRKTQRLDWPSQWERVPQFVLKPPAAVNHDLCPACNAYFYPAQGSARVWGSAAL